MRLELHTLLLLYLPLEEPFRDNGCPFHNGSFPFFY